MLSVLRRHWVLLLMLTAALAARLWGIGYGLPYRFAGDETSLVYGAVKMLQLKTLLPALHADEFRTLYYPPLGAYLLLPVLVPALGAWWLASGLPDLRTFTSLAAVDPTLLYFAARVLAAAAGTATVLVTYGIGKHVGGRRVGWAAAAFLATSFLHLQQSHFYRHWVLTTLAVSLLLWFALRMAQAGRASDYRWAGLVAGLGFGVSYLPVLAFIPVLLAHWGNPHAPRKLRHRPLWEGVALAVVLALAFVLLHPFEFARYSIGEGSGAGLGKSLPGFAASLGYHLRNFAQLEPAMLVLVSIGAPLLWRASRVTFVLLAALPVVYLPTLYLLFHDEVRYLLILLPPLAVVAAFGFHRLAAGAARYARSSAWALTLLVWAFPLAVTIKYLTLLSVPDTRQLALQWVERSLPPGSRVVTDLTSIRLTPTRASLEQQAALEPASLRQEDQALLRLPDERYPQPAYEVLPLHFISQPRLPVELTPEAIQRASFRYLVVEENAAVRPGTLALVASGATVLQQFRSELPDLNGNFALPIFTIFPARRLGPTVTIYELPRVPAT